MYIYADLKPELFTNKGQRQLIKIRDHVRDLLSRAGAVRMREAISVANGDSWTALACIDRMVELGELREVPRNSPATQHRIFVAVD